MITRPITRPLTQPLTRAITALGGSSSSPFDNYQTASLYLDFVSQLYAVQSVEEANANAQDPRPSLDLDFVNQLYFVEA